MPFSRLSGILLHPISLPSRGGIGDFGPAAYEFLDFLAAARQGLWQVLPLNPPANGNSPYSSTSAFAGNPLLISLERLAEHGWLDASELSGLPVDVGPINYDEVRRAKLPLLQSAARKFLKPADGRARSRFDHFCHENAWWLEDFVLFDSLRERHGKHWNQWPSNLARREPNALDSIRAELSTDLSIRRVVQFFFWEQWHALQLYCAQKSIRIVGDIAIFVDYDSADVWAHRNLFRLGEVDLLPEVVSGVPPDYFSATGQRWGNPLYNWDAIRADDNPDQRALLLNVDGDSNNAFGESALFNNTTGAGNTAVGDVAAASGAGVDFSQNTAVGSGALFSGTTANSCNAVGALALGGVAPSPSATPPPNTGVSNNAFGVEALEAITSGGGNVAVGDTAGAALEDGSFNIYVGFLAGSDSAAGENATIRIGEAGFVDACFVQGISGVPVAGDPVVVTADGQLGVAGPASPLSKNELLKQQRVVQELKATTERQAAVIALQEGQIKALTAGLKQQADQIQKVSAQLEMIRPTPRVVENR